MAVAIITGASKGLGRALAGELAGRGWDLVLDARTEKALEESAGAARARGARVVALPGDVTDPAHRRELVAAARGLGGLDLLVSNASALGAEPLVRLDALALDGLRTALETNVVAALGLVQEALPLLRAGRAGAVIAVSSDAAVEAYGTWGGYGASKAALDQLAAVLAVEEPGLRVWAVDPGDMATDLYTAAVPDDDDPRPAPESVVPGFLALIERRPPSGRYAAADLADGTETDAARSGAVEADAARPDAVEADSARADVTEAVR
ncbi:SDR family NAD(P)-dependent oxidoreductase [Streptomyces sp. NPDC015346]|uniref:SDR family NAD(P)-dependent oxidoreductase n=1 Tax=Streptomyces sp. NPDC015346 TaxID=3364954 RepID=UPI0037006BB1